MGCFPFFFVKSAERPSKSKKTLIMDNLTMNFTSIMVLSSSSSSCRVRNWRMLKQAVKVRNEQLLLWSSTIKKINFESFQVIFALTRQFLRRRCWWVSCDKRYTGGSSNGCLKLLFSEDSTQVHLFFFLELQKQS